MSDWIERFHEKEVRMKAEFKGSDSCGSCRYLMRDWFQRKMKEIGINGGDGIRTNCGWDGKARPITDWCRKFEKREVNVDSLKGPKEPYTHPFKKIKSVPDPKYFGVVK